MNGGTENDALMHFLLADSIRQALLRKYGVLLFGDALYEVLGFASVNGFRKAKSNGALPVQVFQLDKRRGNYALTEDVALWLSTRRLAADDDTQLIDEQANDA